MGTNFDVVVVGSCVQDLTSYTARFPRPGESVRGHKFITAFGGKGANQAVTAARLGAKVAMVGKVGDDIFGPNTVENFKQQGIDAEFVEISSAAPTGTASIFVDESGENCIVVNLGANTNLTIGDVRKAENLIKNSKVLTCQLEVPIEVTLEALKIAKNHGVLSIFNPAPGMQNLPDEFFKYADIVCPNENEAEFLTGVKVTNVEDAKKATDALINKGVTIALVTLGAKGSLFRTKDDPKHQLVEAPNVRAVDTTGAGDSFVGSLAFYLAQMPELSLAEKVRRSCVIAAHSVQFPGTQLSYPYRKDLDQALFV